MDRRFMTSMVLKVVGMILFLTSIVVNLATLIGGTASDTSNTVVFLTLFFGWIIHAIDRFFVDKEED